MSNSVRPSALTLEELQHVVVSDPFTTALTQADRYTRETKAEAAYCFYKDVGAAALSVSSILFGTERSDESTIVGIDPTPLICVSDSDPAYRPDLALAGHTHPDTIFGTWQRSVPSAGDLASLVSIEKEQPGTTFFVASPQDSGETLVLFHRAPTPEVSRKLRPEPFVWMEYEPVKNIIAAMGKAGLSHAWLRYDQSGRLISGEEQLSDLYQQRK